MSDKSKMPTNFKDLRNWANEKETTSKELAPTQHLKIGSIVFFTVIAILIVWIFFRGMINDSNKEKLNKNADPLNNLQGSASMSALPNNNGANLFDNNGNNNVSPNNEPTVIKYVDVDSQAEISKGEVDKGKFSTYESD